MAYIIIYSYDLECEDASDRGVTNFNMVDHDLNKTIKKQINPEFEQI